MKWIKIECATEREYIDGIENLKKAGFTLTEQSFGSDHWDKNDTRFWIVKNF